MIEEWRGPFDVALALHACGNATDRVLQMAVARGAAYVASPCCVGECMCCVACRFVWAAWVADLHVSMHPIAHARRTSLQRTRTTQTFTLNFTPTREAEVLDGGRHFFPLQAAGLHAAAGGGQPGRPPAGCGGAAAAAAGAAARGRNSSVGSSSSSSSSSTRTSRSSSSRSSSSSRTSSSFSSSSRRPAAFGAPAVRMAAQPPARPRAPFQDPGTGELVVN
jgi:hypothetical protein